MQEAWIKWDYSDEGLRARGLGDVSLMTKGFLGRAKLIHSAPFRIGDKDSELGALRRIMDYAKRGGYRIDENRTETKL